MTANRVSRRAALTAFARAGLAPGLLGLPALLAGCGGPTQPTSFAPMGWDYLPRLKLNVAVIDIDDSWTPRAAGRERGFLAPTSPVDALRRMAEDRLLAAGTSGKAVFVIDDASIEQRGDSYVGTFAVHLDVSTSEGTRSGYAEARVTRTRSIRDDSPQGVRAELYDMVRQMMADMNVEFEYQVRQTLRDYLQTTAPVAPAPGPVEQQNLAPPGLPSQPAPLAPPEAAAPPPRAPVLAPPPVPAVPSAVPFSSPGPTTLTH